MTAEKDGDVAYVGSDWNEGISPWDFDVAFNLRQADPMLRGTVFSDRGVYRLGEEVHFKAILRLNAPQGIRLLPAGTPVFISVRDSQSRVVIEQTVKVNGWSSAEWTMTLPAEGNLGGYSVRAILESDKPKPKKPEDLRPGDEPGPDMDDYVLSEKSVNGSFLVAAYRRPDFRVDVTMTGASHMAGDKVKASVSAQYLFGAAMPARPATWTWTRTPGYSAPQAVQDALPDGDRWTFVGWREREPDPTAVVQPRSEDARNPVSWRSTWRRSSMPACLTAIRSKRTSRTSRGSTSPIARASRSIPPRGISACGVPPTSSIRRPDWRRN